MLKAHWALLCTLLILSACTQYAREKSVYYVSALGDDTNDGLTAASPWKTLNKVSTHNFQGGDRILFRGGDIFSGLLYFDSSSDSASRQDPITVSSYGGRKATIDAGSGDGIFVYNIGGVEIRNINIVGSGSGSNNGRGIIVYNDLPNTTLEHIVIDNVDVSGFSGTPIGGAIPPSGDGWGIIVAPGSATSQYQYVTITNTASHDNAIGGIFTAPWEPTNGRLISDVYVGNVQAYNNTGISGLNNNHSGNGIALGGVTRGIIEYSKAYNNGASNTYSVGPCGLWSYIATQLTYQFNEAYTNKSASGADGCGFDFDGGVSNSIAQYNYSHDNDGAGFGVFSYSAAPPTQNNIIRYNISENDGRNPTGTQSPITLWADTPTRLMGTDIHNNTIYNNLGTSGSRGIFISTGSTNTTIRNNIIMTTGGKKLLEVASGQLGMVVQNNDYRPNGGAFAIKYNGVTYNSLAAFRSGTGQEKLPLTTRSNVGYNVSPLLVHPSSGGTVDTSSN